MLAPLHAPFSDTRAADLSLELGRERLDAAVVLPVRLGDARLRLAVLGASHQAVLETPAGGCTETVACLPGRPGGLPTQETRDLDGLAYAFRAEVLTLAPADFSAQARALRAEIGRGRHGLVGSVAGDPEALTALRARRRDEDVCWQTWHAYPHTGEIVVTRTRVRTR
jgi:hypothetical protein